MGMLDDDFFVRFVSLFQEMADTVVDRVDSLEHYVDVTVAPPDLVRYLGRWIGVDTVDPSLPADVQRRFVREAGRILRWRGTLRGLTTLLELLSGGPVEVVDSGGVYRQDEAPAEAGHVVMRVPSVGWLDPGDFIELVRGELPAHVTFELYVGDEQLWPTPEAGPGSSPREAAA